MHTRQQALEHHSPMVWCLAATGAAFGVILAGTAVWNAWDHREQLLDLTVRFINHVRT